MDVHGINWELVVISWRGSPRNALILTYFLNLSSNFVAVLNSGLEGDFVFFRSVFCVKKEEIFDEVLGRF